MHVESIIKEMYENRNWDKRVTEIIIEFMTDFQNVYGEKYIDRIIKRLEELEEIREEYDDSKYIASSKRNYIIFFKRIEERNQFKYVLEHELFHFIQKEDSEFEKIPKEYEEVFENEIKIELLEEVFVQYFTAKINNKTPEYEMINKDGKRIKYWLNECYKGIVYLGEKLENKIGQNAMLDMYMDDELYEKERKKFDTEFGNNAFAEYIKEIMNNYD